MSRIVLVPLVVVLLAACQTAKGPAPLPEGYLATPHGLVHRSCIRHLPQGHRITAGGVITSPAGEQEVLPPCRHPRLHSRTHQPIDTSGAQQPPDVNGWAEYAGWLTSTPLGSLSANFVVPSAPASNGGLIYLFPGSEPSDGSTIIQPVLQYGYGAAGGGNYWSAASWYCCPSGWTTHSTLIDVNAGDTIAGTMTSTCASDTCAWTITTSDTTLGNVTSVAVGGIVTPFVWNFGGVLEAYSVTDCSQYPAAGTNTFTNIQLADQNGNALTPSWTNTVIGGLSPQCGYAVTNTTGTVTLTY